MIISNRRSAMRLIMKQAWAICLERPLAENSPPFWSQLRTRAVSLTIQLRGA